MKSQIGCQKGLRKGLKKGLRKGSQKGLKNGLLSKCQFLILEVTRHNTISNYLMKKMILLNNFNGN